MDAGVVSTVGEHCVVDATTPVVFMDDAEMADEWVDRTNEPLREIGNGYQLTPTLRSLCLTNNALSEINNLEECVALNELVLRQNAIAELKGLDHLGELEDLDLSMNKIEVIPPDAFAANPKLKKVDLGFNQIRNICQFPYHNLSLVEELFLTGNKIKEIDGLHPMPHLVMLELGDNRLRRIERLSSLTTLTGLWLGRNKIRKIEGLSALRQLRRLSIQSNRIERIENLEALVNLEELYLSHNGITSMDGVESLSNLRTLDLGSNFIDQIRHVDKLPYLTEFWMNNNKLSSFDELYLLKSAMHLATVYLEGNPLANDRDYEAKVLEILPDTLDQLDASYVIDVRRELERKALAARNGDPDEDVIEEEIIDQVDTQEAGRFEDEEDDEYDGMSRPTGIASSPASMDLDD